MSNYRNNLETRHSFYGTEARRRDTLYSEAACKSDISVSPATKSGRNVGQPREKQPRKPKEKHGDSCEYYRTYELDEIPVKDECHSNKTFYIEGKESDRASLTNSDLEKLENKIYNNVSQELQTDDSVISLESNIKFLKTTVQEIFDKFNTCMNDFELYKKRFEEILAKNRVDSIADMEDFIKDMIHHIMSSESSLSRESRNWAEMSNLQQAHNIEDPSITSTVSEKQPDKLLESLHSVVEAYKNENYLTDSTFEEKSSKYNNCPKMEETFNIYLLSGVPYVQIKMNDRNLLSEINIKDQSHQEETHVASAENLKSLAAKKQELEQYVKQKQESPVPDREIPLKVSFAKKNIYLNEDFAHERDKEDNRSLMSKICSYICKKIRKS